MTKESEFIGTWTVEEHEDPKIPYDVVKMLEVEVGDDIGFKIKDHDIVVKVLKRYEMPIWLSSKLEQMRKERKFDYMYELFIKFIEVLEKQENNGGLK